MTREGVPVHFTAYSLLVASIPFSLIVRAVSVCALEGVNLPGRVVESRGRFDENQSCCVTAGCELRSRRNQTVGRSRWHQDETTRRMPSPKSYLRYTPTPPPACKPLVNGSDGRSLTRHPEMPY
ncbi:hypothetical protein F4823DRAFT_546394 [Ustulina deusta]|nr:hypothetical protein F4823DRAFT_546394 [Ustulina deusta]